MSFDVYFGNNLHVPPASTAWQAVEGMVGYLESVRKDYLKEIPDPENEKAEIVILDDLVDEFIPLDVDTACDILENTEKITIVLKTSSKGPFDLARAETYIPDLSAPIEDATQESTLICTKVLTTDDPQRIGHWKPSDVYEIQVLQAAEIRLFAIRLRKLIDRIPLEVRCGIDHQCDFVDGTIARFLHPVDPIKPTSKQIDKIARLFKVNPHELWVNLVSYYFGQVGWPNLNEPFSWS